MVCVYITTEIPLSPLTDSPCGGCGQSVWPPTPKLLIQHLTPPLLQYPAAKPLGLKIELINTLVSTNEMTVSWWTVYLLDQLSRRVSGNVKREGNQYYNVLPVSSENGLDDRKNLSHPLMILILSTDTNVFAHLWVVFVFQITSGAHVQPRT